MAALEEEPQLARSASRPRGRRMESTVSGKATDLSVLSQYVPSSTLSKGITAATVTNALREAILDGALPPLTWLREVDVASELGVSRTPVREGLSRLYDEGLVTRTANSGAFVAAITLEQVLAVYTVRETLESTVTRLVAGMPNHNVVTELNAIHDKMKSAASSHAGVDELAALNLQFHAVIRQAAHNPYLDRFLVEIEHAVRRFRYSAAVSPYDRPSRLKETLSEHQVIIDAITAQDPDRAAEVAASHMRNARTARIEAIIAAPSGTATPLD